MIGRFVCCLILLYVIGSGVQADLTKYVEFATGKEGRQERCYAQSVLFHAIDKYKDESVVKELKSDLLQLNEHLEIGKEFQPEDLMMDCYQYRNCPNSRHIEQHLNTRPSRYLRKICARLIKFEHLCDLMRAKRSADSKKLAIQNWICQVRDETKKAI